MKWCLHGIIGFVLIVSIYGYNDEIAQELTPEPEPQEPSEIVVDKYHLYTSRVNWTEAMRLCRTSGMELVSILSKEQNDRIKKAIKDARQGAVGFWISANRRKTNDKFFWGNGKAVTFTDWDNGMPDNHNYGHDEEEKCIEIKGYHVLKWNDHLCSYGLYYICEETSANDN